MSKALKAIPLVMLTEAVGTPIFLGCGFASMEVASKATSGGPAATLILIFGFGFGLMIAASIVGSIPGDVSMGHFNPAVSLGIAFTSVADFLLFLPRVIAQFAGVYGLVKFMTYLRPESLVKQVSYYAPAITAVSANKALVMEGVGAFVLVATVVMTTYVNPTRVAPFYIGMSLMFGIMIAGPYTGAGLNPARSIVPLFMKHADLHLVVYGGGPMLGGLAGAAFALCCGKWGTRLNT